ncbi:LytTR family DNA-binding domain-containing protein [uncultured Arcticibacterium sp.]|uniref:LytR/AlgR family response regulator transcription factor n=1 Tax=uncultured Arcticibacterium sp. TaxID=2173042 RepID=UPI0030FCC3D9
MKNTSEFHIPVKIGARKEVLPQQILMLKADQNYTEVFLLNGSKILSSTNLGTIEKRLAGNAFFRVNRSTVINTKHIIKSGPNNLILQTTKTGKSQLIKISRRRINPFLAFTNPNN